ncbi:ATP-binding protein [Streptomyces ardesiacus]|uniref:ATP-binding protein n=1 Tax=Streptomyces ardesiacus TaxID=285564 RepID=UPI003659259E
MTTRQEGNAHLLVQGPVHAQRWGSVGFRIDDPQAVRECRRAARWMLGEWRLTWVPELVDDVGLMVSELVTNVQRHAGDSYPAGSFTLWHPGRRLVLTVHDKGELPWRSGWWSRAESATDWETGRGLALVRALAAEHIGEVDVVDDKDRARPGKVVRVSMLLPNREYAPVADPFKALAKA